MNGEPGGDNSELRAIASHRARRNGLADGLILLLAVVLLLASMPRGGGARAPFRYWTTHALIKVRPHDAAPRDASQSVALRAARNEFEPFQVVLQTNGGVVEDVDVAAGDLAGPGGATIAGRHITVYLERYINLAKPSSVEGAAGEWPDALIPRVDRYFGEKRNAFPFRLEPGRNQPVWVDVYVPERTPLGLYTGQMKLLVKGVVEAAIPIKLQVWDFSLPSTSSLPNSFGFNGAMALKEHLGRYTNDSDLLRITQVYAKAALLHRISIHGGSMAPPRMGESQRIDWSNYEKEMGPFIEGKVLGADDPLPGARLTAMEARLPSELPDDARVAYLAQWVEHHHRKGWQPRLFYYLWDEPNEQLFNKVAQLGRVSHRVPGIRNLVTVALTPRLQSVTDIWVPLINCFENKPGFPPYCPETVPREAYDGEQRAGKNVWWYQSCASHGCNTTGGEYFRGWPSYMIDVGAISNRIAQWLAWKYKIEGELYFNMDEAYLRKPNPWEDVALFGGNGDGTLLYPGKPAVVGGSSDIPIESIRLKLIREGLEDYEYLALCARRGLSEFAQHTADALAPRLYRWDTHPEALYAARAKLGERLSRQDPAAQDSPPGR